MDLQQNSDFISTHIQSDTSDSKREEIPGVDDQHDSKTITMELNTSGTLSNRHLIPTHTSVDSSDRRREEILSVEGVQITQHITMELDASETGTNCHSMHTHISVDASNKKRDEISEVEDIQTRQSDTVEQGTSELDNTVKQGQDILLPPSVQFKEACVWHSLYIFIILVSSILFTIPATLFPFHNSMKNPEYWWELMIPGVLGLSVYETLNIVMECQIIFTFETFKSFKVFLRLLSINALTVIITICLCFIIWTLCMGNNHPIPYLGLIIILNTTISQYIALWFQFPYLLRSDKKVRNRIWAYLLYRVWSRFHAFQQQGLKTMMVILPLEIQWIMAIILPIHRELILLSLIHI